MKKKIMVTLALVFIVALFAVPAYAAAQTEERPVIVILNAFEGPPGPVWQRTAVDNAIIVAHIYQHEGGPLVGVISGTDRFRSFESEALFQRPVGWILVVVEAEGFQLPDPVELEFRHFEAGDDLVWFASVLHYFEEGVTPEPTPEPSPQPPPPADARVLSFAIGQTTFTDDGTAMSLDAATFIQDGRTMVPLRVIIEALGATNVEFSNNTVFFRLAGENIVMPIGQPLPGGMGTPVLINGRTFVPLAYASNILGAITRWDDANRVAYIYIV